MDELEKLYKDEHMLRKKYFNMMEDMKGKIRVYCRARPMLGFEQSKGQQFALIFNDELTLSHPWKEERKPREYTFDTVFEPACSQAQVFEDTKYLVQSAVDGYNVCIFAYGQVGCQLGGTAAWCRQQLICCCCRCLSRCLVVCNTMQRSTHPPSCMHYPAAASSQHPHPLTNCVLQKDTHN